MILVKDFDTFVNDEKLDLSNDSRETVSVRIDKNRLKYIKYIGYMTGETVSSIINDTICLNREDFSTNELCGTICGETYATTCPDNLK